MFNDTSHSCSHADWPVDPASTDVRQAKVSVCNLCLQDPVLSRLMQGAVQGCFAPQEMPILSYENIFRSAFQEVPVEQATEDISTIEHFLGVSSEEHPGRPAVHRLCCDSRRLWKALQSSNPASVTHYLWRGSCCQERLLLLLGIEANQSLSGGQDPILEGSGLGEPGELVAVSAFPLWPCKALIQTKLSGTPGSPRGSLVTYSLFLKTPLHGHEPSFAAPQEKTFPPHSLKVAFFNDVC
ncbi:uncharacterized protein CLBA1 isoform 2-T2 [Thomomys bottae]